MEAAIEESKKAREELRKNFRPEDLSPAARERILAQLDKYEVLAYKCKIGVWAKEIQSDNPSISFKGILMETLNKLPDTLSVAALKELVDYTGEVWNEANTMVAA